MNVEPAFEQFAAAYEAGKPQVVWTRLIADLETPVSALLKLADGRPNSFLLESVEGGRSRGRYSLIGLKPDVIWRCRGDKAEINRDARFQPDRFVRGAERRARVVARADRGIAHRAAAGPAADGRPACSATCRTTWCGWWRRCRTSSPRSSVCRTASSCARR